MALIQLADLTNVLEETRSTLLSAADGDGIVSRDDLKQLLSETEDPMKKGFLEFFYDFLRKLEDRPRMRVTEDVIDRGISFIQEQLIPKFEIKENFLTQTEQEIAQIHETALPIAMELIRYTASEVGLSPLEVSEQIAPLTEGLLFDDYGSEAAIQIEPFFVEHAQPTLSPSSFVAALGLEPDTPKATTSRYESADRVLLTFIEQHVRSGLSARARAIVDLMQTNLNDLRVIIMGLDNHPDLESNHPVYVVGIGLDGNLAGFQSVVIWT